jgi:uncharacterized protein YbaP (TraB family)
MRSFLPLLALALSTAVFAQNSAQTVAPDGKTHDKPIKAEKMKGLLWEISGNGAAHPSYLYGTMHVSEKLAFNLSDSFFVALRNVDVVALETDCDGWQKFQDELADSRGGMGPDRYYRARRSGTNLYNGAFQFETPSNEVLGAMLSYKPYLSNEFLYRSEDYRADYEENTYLDLFIHQAGKKLGKKVIGLETIEGSYEAVTRSGLPPDDKDDDERYNRGYVSRDDFEGAYRDQDLSLLDSLDRMMTPGKHYRRWMLDERNVVMADGIDSIMRRGERIFAAVGAAHLPGDEMGVIQLLRKKGYAMRPVRFNTVADPKEKEGIEKLRYPVKMSTQWAADSSWAADAPGKFYPTVEAAGFAQNLYADMSNGAYYAVYQVKTNGFWTGQSQDYIAKRIDSLLYERVPGKIQERKRLEGGPFPGHEVTTRTRRGDILRYKILITPFDVLVFLIGGTGEYALGEEASQFLRSARVPQVAPAAQPTATWLRPQHGGFELKFPASLLVNTTDQHDQLERPDDFVAATLDPRDQAAYFLLRREYHDWSYIEEDTFELNIIGEKIAEAYTKTPPQVRFVSGDKYPTQDISFRADKDSAQIHLRLVIDGPAYYLLGCRSRSAVPPTDFFESFRVLPDAYPEGWKEKRDTSVKFTASVPKLPEKPVPAFVDRIQKLYREASERRGGYDGYSSRFKSTTLVSPSTGEKVQVTMREMPAFEAFPMLDSLKQKTEDELSGNKKVLLRDRRWYEQKGMLVADITVQDTNSNRGIRYKVVVVNRKTYMLSATINLDKPESEFMRRVFDTFSPTDTASSESPWGKRNLDFLKNIYASDSLQRKKALKELDRAFAPDLKAEDFDAVRAAIEDPGFGKLKFSDRKNLLDLAGGIKSPKRVPYLLDFYQKSGDSLRYRALVAENLAGIETKEAYQAVLRLLLEQPIQRQGYGEGLFAKLNDSLELAATLFPDLLKLAELDDFQDKVFDLLFLVQQEGLVKPRAYASQKKRLLANADFRLTRYRLGWENDMEDGDDDENYSYAGSNNSSTLKRNLMLLAPFAQKDKQVRALMERTLRLGDEQLKLFVYGLYLREGIPVQPAVLQPFAAKRATLATVYATVASAKKLADYPAAWFADTTALLESAFFGKGGKSGSNIDSVRLVSRHKTVFRSGPAWLYFFDVKRKKEKEWTLAYAYVPKDMAFLADTKTSGIVQNNGGYNARNRQHYRRQPEVQVMHNTSGKKREEAMKKKIGATRFENRERYSGDSGGPEYYRQPEFEF